MRKFPDGPVLRTQSFHSQEYGFNPWSRNEDPTSPVWHTPPPKNRSPRCQTCDRRSHLGNVPSTPIRGHHMDQGWTTQLSPFWIPTQQKHGQEETPWLKPSIWSRELKQEPVFLLCSLLTFILSPGLTFSKSFYILALVGIWVINPYLNQSGDLLKLCELWKIRILKINA